MHLRALIGHRHGGFGAQEGLREQWTRTGRQCGGRKCGTIAENGRRGQTGESHYAISAVDELESECIFGLFERLPRSTLPGRVESQHFHGIGGHDIVGRTRVDDHFVLRSALRRCVGQFDGATTHAQQQ